MDADMWRSSGSVGCVSQPPAKVLAQNGAASMIAASLTARFIVRAYMYVRPGRPIWSSTVRRRSLRPIPSL